MTDSPSPSSPPPAGPEGAKSPAETPKKPRIRLTAIFGTLASAAWIVAFFLPWMHVVPTQRERVRAAFEPGLERLKVESAEDEARYRLLLKEVVEHGALTGLDLFHYARSAYALNVRWQGEAPADHREGWPWAIQRGLHAMTLVLGALPLLSLLIVLRLVSQGFRGARTGVLIGLTVVGCAGGAPAIAWLRFAGGLEDSLLPGIGVQVGLVASTMQACAGLFGVSSKNWWRVYSVSLLLLGAVASFAYLYVVRGLRP